MAYIAYIIFICKKERKINKIIGIYKIYHTGWMGSYEIFHNFNCVKKNA